MSDLWVAFAAVWQQITAYLEPMGPLGPVLAFVIVAVLGFSLLRGLLRLVW